MSLKIFITSLFLFSFAFTSVSHADESASKRTKKKEEAVKILSGRCMKKDSAKKETSFKDKQLSRDLAILEKNMERKVDNKAFDDIYKRYVGLIRLYGEADRAINFFDGLTKRHPQSPNALAVSGAITYAQRDQMMLQNGFGLN
jgi:hypothetical protein